ncbi:hypothetical protein E6C50_03180 [Flavobacterium supellecticarium]|uniref:Uncharacterized protein n=1 Tax=Flavobacterium supellecticarium TaxID=2565924 RepID=A0A4S4A436_9FLAO|nr:hypothetical protein [Flavobacterium supellecticarium]THF53219.1 hypothetical protein E6C50_03180 [Flavobacterium supellecticarium]
MIIGKIAIDLAQLHYSLLPEVTEAVQHYLSNKNEITTIRKLIEVITNEEFILYINEAFMYFEIYENCEFNPVTAAQLQEFIKYKVIDPNVPNARYFCNFYYENGKCIDPKKGIDAVRSYEPCLIEFSHTSMMTYYVFDWYLDEYRFEIED